MRSKLLLGVLSLFVYTLKAQEGFLHYTSDQGLPSSEVYDVLCDKKGFIWISTDRGVSRFNGYTFENFYTSDGLTDNVIIEMFEDGQNRIWFSANSGQLCYYDYVDARIHTYAYNDSIYKHMPGLVVYKSLRIDSAGTLHVGYLHYGAVSLTKEGKLSVICGIYAKPKNYYKVFFSEVQGQPFTYSSAHYSAYHDSVIASINLPGMHYRLSLPFIEGHFLDHYFFKRKNGTYVFSVPGYLIEAIPGRKPLVQRLTDDVRRICEDRSGRLWLCLRKEGLRLYEPGEGIASLHYKTLLAGKYANAICEDREQGMWTGVYNDALYYLPMQNVKVEKVPIPETQVVRSLDLVGNELYIGTGVNCLYRLHTDGRLDSLLLPKAIVNVSKVMAIDSGLMVFGAQRCFIKGKRIEQIEKGGRFLSVYCIYETDSIIYTGSHSCVLRFLAHPPYTEKQNTRLGPCRIEAIFNDNGRLLLGSTVGVYCLMGDTIVSYNHWFDKACRTTDIKTIGGYLVFSTLGEGIRFRHRTTGKQFTLSTRQNLLSNNINSLCVNDSSLWAASGFGVNEIRFSRDSFRVYSYTLSNGLKVSEIRRLYSYNNRLWMITSKGLYSLGLSEIVNNPESIPVHILAVSNADTVYTGASLLKETEVHYNSILRVHYVGLSYKQHKDVRYRYRLLGHDSTCAYTKNTEVEFAFLSDGDYTFELCASNEDGEWSPPVTFRFFIKPPFWKTWWFIAGSGFLVLAIVFCMFTLRIRRLQKENRIREQLYDYRQQALVARMNPHFIFNSLNSIHYFIFNEDKRVAGKYLSRFASLMRLILDQSTREYVPLEEDIRALNLYMELEAWRFSNKFKVDVRVDEALDQKAIRVPPMLVQPFVENAIKHGLLNRLEGEGRLEVCYRFVGRNLECRVDDNGVGREEAERVRQGSAYQVHQSAGTAITLQRLETACEKNGQTFLLEYTDKQMNTHQETGTQVRFYIPHIYDKNTDY